MRKNMYATVPVLALTFGLALTGCGTSTDSGTFSHAPQAPKLMSDDEVLALPATPYENTGNGDRTTAGLNAIATAEKATGGTAYAIDDEDDDNSWEVDIATGNSTVEVEVDATGAHVLSKENDDDRDDDRRLLDQVSVPLAEAITTAVTEVPGVLDGAELDDDRILTWEVTVDTTDRSDVEVAIDAATGSVVAGNRDADDDD